MHRKPILFAVLITLVMVALSVTAVIASKGISKGITAEGTTVAWGCTNDKDCDTIPDSSDNCPDVANTDQADKDGDGVGDVCDANPHNGNVSRLNLDDMAIKMEHSPTIQPGSESTLSLNVTLSGCGDCAGNTFEGSWTGTLEFECTNHGDNTVYNASFSPGEGDSGPIGIGPSDVSSSGKVKIQLVAPADLTTLKVADICPSEQWTAELTGISVETLTLQLLDPAQTFEFNIDQDCTGTNASFICSAK